MKFRRMTTMTRTCKKCEKNLAVGKFRKMKARNRKVHRRWVCKKCEFGQMNLQNRQYKQDWRKRNKERCAEVARNWAKANPLKRAEAEARRRAAKKSCAGEKIDFFEIGQRDSWVCYLCLTGIEADDISFDHVIPLSRGGAHSSENIRVTHLNCNVRKGDRMVSELK